MVIRTSYLICFSLMLLVFPSCNKTRKAVESEAVRIDRGLLDTIRRLDSLSFSYCIPNNTLSETYANRALALTADHTQSECRILALSAKANSFTAARSDSEYFYISQALKLSDELGSVRWKPVLLENLAELYMSAGNASKAILLLDTAIILSVRAKNFAALSSAYDKLGNLHLNVMHYEAARKYYDSAYFIASNHSMNREAGIALGSLAQMEELPEQQRKKEEEAAVLLRKSGRAAESLADILINIGLTFTDPDSAITYYRKALDILHPGQFPEEEIKIYNNLAYSYIDKGLLKEAKSYLIDRAIPQAEKLKNNAILSTVYDTYADVLVANGDLVNAIRFEKKSIEKGTQSGKESAAGQVRLLSAMLDLKNKELLIIDKNHEIIQHIATEKTFLQWILLSCLSLVILTVIFILYRVKNKLRFQREKNASARRILELEEAEKRKLSRELHDISGLLKRELISQFSGIAIPPGKEKDEMKNQLEAVSDQIRSMSHHLSSITINDHDIGALIEGLCREFIEFSKVEIFCSVLPIPGLSEEIKLHIFRMVQEMLNNAAKYAGNAIIKVNLSTDVNGLKLVYSDNGDGFDPLMIKNNGLGLISITERAGIIGGKATLNAFPGGGVYWEVSIPLVRTTKN
jgi:signal transduction histidine kinase